ncbi:hypothetical protein TUM4261_21040 [Shewanella sp. c952]|uniref:hypothetical protein n=1 Tax=Shewanella sp. c952 TaxID=2815913 RepID=UPI001BC668A9|nr:hypothetical protein [Shewanella sp. c952]GIU10667.1 hypothetical protein TUM4261_21040 [Shewanella sp. c952]
MNNYVKADATHIDFPISNREEHFEWWYFDAHLDNGDHIVVMYSLNDTRLKPRAPSVRLNIYPQGKPDIWKMTIYPESEVTTSYDKCDVTFGEEYCRDCGDYYEIYTLIEGYGAKLRLSKKNHPFTTEGVPFPLPWTVAVPSGDIEGEIYKDGQTTMVKGVGYHDHNWGDKNLAGTFKNWYWGKVHTPDISIDYAMFMNDDDTVGMPIALVTTEDSLLMTPTDARDGDNPVSFDGEVNVTMTDETMGYTFAKEFTLSGTKEDVSFTLNVKLADIVMIEEGKLLPGEDVYRYIGEEVLTVTRNNKTKVYNESSLHEIVYLKS